MSQITDFIDNARKRGYSDRTIKEAFLNAGWPVEKIDSAFQSLSPKFKSKNQVCIFLSDDLMNVLEKSAKKNMLSISEQIEDILRRSTLSFKKSGSASDINDKLDDHLISLFSRKRTGKRK
jgi:hypothetical protein